MKANGWLNASKRHGACPLCDHLDWCSFNEDKLAVLCRRTDIAPPGWERTKPAKDGIGFVFVVKQNSTQQDLEQWKRERSIQRKQREHDERAKRAKSLSLVERERQFRKLLDQLSLSPLDKTDLQRRGLTDEEIKLGGFKSVEVWQKLDFELDHRLPGVNLDGHSLNIKPGDEGYLCPIKNVDGLIIGCQLRRRAKDDSGRYRWLTSATRKRPNGATSHLPNGELPLSVHRPTELKSKIIGLVEGTGAKPFIAAQRIGQVVLGAASGNFANSPEQFKETLNFVSVELNTKKIILYADGGAIANPHIMQQYRNTYQLATELGFQVSVGWWGQYTKDDPDIDELSTDTKIEVIPFSQFEEIAKTVPAMNFCVSTEKQAYYCFHCKAGGNAIKFLMEIGSQSFIDVVLKLAEKHQVPVEWDIENPNRVTPETIELVKGKTDIVEVISEHLELTQRGKDFQAVCPFHNQKEPEEFDVDDEQADDDQPITVNEKLTPTQKAWIRLQEIYGGRTRWNEMTLRCEIDGKPAKNLESLYLDLELDYGISVSKEKTYDLIIRLARLNAYHPVKEYLDRVAAKVEPINIDNLATRFFKTTLPIYDAMLKAHLIGSVKRVFEPGCKKDEALILQGKQGIGKSTFFSKLYGREFFSDSLKGTDRDSLLILHQYWCLEMAEIESITGKREVGELKSFITSQEDTFRSPYGKSSEPHERQSVLVGTVNPQTFLQDETGNRRFWVIPVKSRIDSFEVETLRDAIWASAVLAYRNGSSSILTHEQESMVNDLNLNYVHHDTWTDVISDFLIGRSQVTCREILEKALLFEINRIDKKAEMRVGNVLRKLGWERTTGYYLGKTMKYWQPSSLTTLPPLTTSEKEVVTLTQQDLQPPLPPILQTFQNGQIEEAKPDSHAPSESESVENAHQNNQEEKVEEKGGKGGKNLTEQALPPQMEVVRGGKGGNAENVVDAIADTAPKELNIGDTVVLVSGGYVCPEYMGDLIVYKIDGFFNDKIACQTVKGDITTWLNIEDLRLKNKK